ncbi:transposase [Microbispora hainanensis]|uniref:transposase n=1 Tax=Microbispora hainanensis TaxID=568844 RepID=UPI003AF34895
MPPVRGKRGACRGRLRRRPDVVVGDRGYDHDKYRRHVRALGVRSQIARRGTEHGSGLGKQRWVVEQTIALAAQLPQTAHPLESPRGHPPRLPQHRPAPPHLIVLVCQ